MKLNFLYFLIIIFFFAINSVPAQITPADAAKDVKFQLSFANGKTVYRIGEPIKLTLSYTSAQPGYVVESYYSPRFDDVIISPTDGVYDWLNRLNRLYSYDDVSAPQQLSQTPINIGLTINNLVRFDKPGKYKVKVITKRIRFSKGESSFMVHPIPLLSNEIEFEIKEMSDIEEQDEVKRITALMDSAKNLNQHQIVKMELDYLTGDASTVEKVNRFLKPPVYNGITWLDNGTGLNIARNKKLAVELLETALRDPNRETIEGLIEKIVSLRLLIEDEQQPSQATTPEKLWKERAARSAELTQAYYADFFESLPKRSGRVQLGTAYKIFTALGKDTSSPAYTTTRALLLEKFDELPHYEQSTLLDRYWDKLKTPSLIPSLEKILSNKEPVPVWSNRANALKRLIELDQKRARPYVIKEIQDPNTTINYEILNGVDDKYLPEVDDALLEQIQKLVAIKDRRVEYKFLLAARYATRKIYKELLDIYKKYEADKYVGESGPLLSYLLRHNEKEITPLIEDSLVKSKETSGFNVFYSLTRVGAPEGLEKILRNRLESDDPDVFGTASYYLSSKYPNKDNRRLIEKRLERWSKEWTPRKGELNDPKSDKKIKRQTWGQNELLNSLLRTPSWKLSETERYQLKLTCLTEECRRNFSSRPQVIINPDN